MAENILDQFKENQEVKTIDTSKKLKVGIIGTGWIADAHIVEYKRMPDVEIVAGADLVPGKAEAFKEKWGVQGDVHFYPDHKSMIDNEELDAVSVCTYNATHAECTIYALEHGVNVLLEKPMCVTLDEAAEIVKAEKKSGKILSIGFQPRYDANMQMIKKIVESGTLGEIYYIQTGGGRRRGIPNSTFIEKRTAGIGALGDIGCYSLDMVLNAIGYPTPKTVSAYSSNFFGTSTEYQSEYDAKRFDVDDFAAAFIRLEPGKYGDKDGIILDFRIAWAMHVDTPGDTIIFGKKAALRIPSTDCWNGSVGGPMKIYHDVAGARVETVIPIIQNKGQGLFYKKVRSFLDAIKTNGTSPVPSSQIIKKQAILDGIVKSAAAGKEVDIVMPEV